MTVYRLNDSCLIPQERARTHFLNDRSVCPLTVFRTLTLFTQCCCVILCRLAETIRLGKEGQGTVSLDTDIRAPINGINSMEETATLLEV